jgi:hypothetical protein
MPWPMLLRPTQLSALPAWPSHLRQQVGSPCQPLRSWVNKSPHAVCQHGLTLCLWRVGPQPSHTPFSPCATRFRWHVGPTQPYRSSCNGLSVAPPHVMRFYRWPNRLRWGKGRGAITRRVEHQTSAYPLPAELQSSPKGSARFEGGESVPLSSGGQSRDSPPSVSSGQGLEHCAIKWSRYFVVGVHGSSLWRRNFSPSTSFPLWSRSRHGQALRPYPYLIHIRLSIIFYKMASESEYRIGGGGSHAPVS